MCNNHKEGCCCCIGAQGPQGPMGFQGQQGIQGVPGLDGSPGLTGPVGPVGPMGLNGRAGPVGSQGPTGPVGPQGVAGVNGKNGDLGPVGPSGPIGPSGPQGLQGTPGLDCDCECACTIYANVYSSLSQVIGAFGSLTDNVLFDKQNAVSTGDFDLTLSASLGEIKFLSHAIYQVDWKLQGRVQPPIPEPVPSFSFGLFLNGVLIPGSIYSAWTQSPNDAVVGVDGFVQIEVKPGDILLLKNTCTSIVDLNPSVLGSVFPITIASINIACLKSLP